MGLIFNGNNGTDTISATDGSLVIDGLDLGGVGNINAGIGTFSGNLNVGGVLTYEDVKNVDSVGIVTARSGIDCNGTLEVSSTSNFDGTVKIADKIEHLGDSNTNIRFPAADTVAVETGGTERLRIKSDGRVGIGEDSPDSLLHIKAGNDRSAIRLENTYDSPDNVWELIPGISGVSNTGFCIRDITDSANRLVIDGSGNLGIGLNNPGAVVHAYHATSNTIAQFESGDAGAAAIWKDNSTYSSVEQNASDFIIHADPGASHAGSALSFKIDGNERLRITNAGFVTINSSSYEALKITTTENGNNGPEVQLIHNSASPAANDCVGQLRFSGKDSAGNTDLMSRIETIIDDPTSGQETAHLNFATRGYAAFNTILRLKARGTASAPSYTTDDMNGIILDTYNTGNPYPRYFNFIAKSAGNTDSNIGFWTESVGGSPTEKLRISSDGKFGINESSPDHMFHIKGTSANNDPILAVETSSWATGRSAALRLAYTDGNPREIRGHYDHGLQFFLNQGEAMRIETDQDIRLSGGDAGTNYGWIRGWQPSTGDMIIGADHSATGTGTSKSNLIFRSRGSEKMRIHSSGDVSIGRDSVLGSAKLSIQCDAAEPGISVQLNASAGTSDLIKAYSSAGPNVASISVNPDASPDLLFKLYDGSNTVERLRIRDTGEVGINCTPTRPLHIVGNDGSSGATSGNSDTTVILENAGTNGSMIEFLNANNGAGHLMFTDTDGVNRGRISYHHNGDFLRIDTSGSERLQIDSNGRLTLKNNSGKMIDCRTSSGTGNCWISLSKSDGTQKGYFGYGSSSSEQLYIVQQENADITIYNGSQSRWYFKTDGQLNSATDGNINVYGGANNHPNDAIIYCDKTSNADWCISANAQTNDYGIYTRVGQYSAYGIGVYDHSNSAWRFRVNGAGTIFASATTITSISDRRLKQNIVDANSQWDDIKGLKFKNYQWKDVPGYSHADGKTYLGLISDEVEPVSPNLIDPIAQTKEDIENEVPDPEYKGVKYSIVWMKAVKALQEAQERIETLEAKVATLEGS